MIAVRAMATGVVLCSLCTVAWADGPAQAGAAGADPAVARLLRSGGPQAPPGLRRAERWLAELAARPDASSAERALERARAAVREARQRVAEGAPTPARARCEARALAQLSLASALIARSHAREALRAARRAAASALDRAQRWEERLAELRAAPSGAGADGARSLSAGAAPHAMPGPTGRPGEPATAPEVQ